MEVLGRAVAALRRQCVYVAVVSPTVTGSSGNGRSGASILVVRWTCQVRCSGSRFWPRALGVRSTNVAARILNPSGRASRRATSPTPGTRMVFRSIVCTRSSMTSRLRLRRSRLFLRQNSELVRILRRPACCGFFSAFSSSWFFWSVRKASSWSWLVASQASTRVLASLTPGRQIAWRISRRAGLSCRHWSHRPCRPRVPSLFSLRSLVRGRSMSSSTARLCAAACCRLHSQIRRLVSSFHGIRSMMVIGRSCLREVVAGSLLHVFPRLWRVGLTG